MDANDFVTIADEEPSWFEAFVPDDLHALAEFIEDVSALDAAAGGKEATDDASDVVADIECLWVVDTDTFHTEAETTDTGEHHSLALTQFLFEHVLKFRDDTRDGAFRETTVSANLLTDFVECNLTLTHGLGKVSPVRTATLNVVPNKSDMYCHNYL